MISIALAGILVPMVVGLGLFFVAIPLGNNGSENEIRGCMFWALALTATNSQERSQILPDLKLLGVEWEGWHCLHPISLISALYF